METTARRYQSPVTPPRLIRPTVTPPPSLTTPPILNLNGLGRPGGHVAPRLVSFAWGAVSQSHFRR